MIYPKILRCGGACIVWVPDGNWRDSDVTSNHSQIGLAEKKAMGDFGNSPQRNAI